MEDLPVLTVEPESQFVTVEIDDPTLSVIWDRAAQEAARLEFVGPTIAARVYALTHTAIYDAWASYVDPAIGVHVGNTLQRPAEENTDANKSVAMSYAAYSVLTELFRNQVPRFDQVLDDLGLLPPDQVTTPSTAMQLGLDVAAAVMADRRIDGSNQLDDYERNINYEPLNESPLDVVDVSRWTPENIPLDPEDRNPEQEFLTPHWGLVDPFALPSGDALRPPPPEPFFMPGVEANLDLDGREGDLADNNPRITLADGTVLEVSPALVGTIINPKFIEQAETIIEISANLTDEQKLIAEFWEDGPGTSFPPGTLMTFGHFVSARDDNDLDTDVQLFFMLGNAMLDTSIATWEAKTFYDYARPVRVIRDLGEMGLVGRPGIDSQTGEFGFVIESWVPNEGTQTILAENWLSYQDVRSDPSPDFAEYTSGHSAFGLAGVEILRSFTGSDDFGASVTFPAGSSRFEPAITPAAELTLSWETFSDVGEQNGLSRLYGGIHFEDGDFNGRLLGAEAGKLVYAKALTYIDGTADDPVPQTPSTVNEIARLYDLAFGRRADFDGLNFWIDVSERGRPLSDIATAILSSDEMAAAGVNDDDTDAFIAYLFANLGEANPSPEELAPFRALADAGGSFGDILAEMAQSDLVSPLTPEANTMIALNAESWWYA